MDAKRAALFEESTRDFLRKSLGKDVSLRRLKSFETRPLFKMTDSGGDSAFVKVTTCAETAKRAYALLSRTSLPFMPRAKFLFEREGRFVMGMSWMEGRVVPPEEMNERQCASLLRAHKAVLDELKGTDCAPPIDSAASYRVIADFAARHRLAGRSLRGLVGIPEAERTLSPEAATATIGDFHCDNYAFDGDEVSAFYDFDCIMEGSPAEDLSYAFIRRARMTNMSGARLANLKERFAQAVSSGTYPAEEWRRSVNRFRVENAAKRLRSHPGLGLVVIDVAGRDRRIKRLMDVFG